MVPNDTSPFSLEPVNVTLPGKDFVHAIPFRILRWEHYPGLSKWALDIITRIPVRERQRKIWHRQKRRRYCDHTSGNQWHSHKPRNTGHHQKLKERASEGVAAPPTPRFQPSDADFRLRASELTKNRFIMFEATEFMGICYRNSI